MLTNVGTGCRYERLGNGIHVFTFDLPSRAAMDEWAMRLRELCAGVAPGEAIRYIMDIRKTDMLPVYSTYKFGREWFSGNADAPHMRTAVLHNCNAHMTVTQDFIRLLRANPHWAFHFFNADQLADAYDWLLSDS
jgi:hypothetical protein